jgi:hypothetical protein
MSRHAGRRIVGNAPFECRDAMDDIDDRFGVGSLLNRVFEKVQSFVEPPQPPADDRPSNEDDDQEREPNDFQRSAPLGPEESSPREKTGFKPSLPLFAEASSSLILSRTETKDSLYEENGRVPFWLSGMGTMVHALTLVAARFFIVAILAVPGCWR